MGCAWIWAETASAGSSVNMADEALAVDFPADSYGDDRKTRHIETRPQISHYTVETSLDGKVWTLREDVARECSNGYYEYADGICARYIRVTGGELPYGQALRISGLRVFGNGEGACPAQADAKPCAWMRWTAKSAGSISRTRRAAMCATALHRINCTRAGLSMMPMRSRFPR